MNHRPKRPSGAVTRRLEASPADRWRPAVPTLVPDPHTFSSHSRGWTEPSVSTVPALGVTTDNRSLATGR